MGFASDSENGSEDGGSGPRGAVRLAPGTLWPRTRDRAARALRCGALQPLATDSELVSDGGVRFLVRVVRQLARKERVKKRQERDAEAGQVRDPFLPYEEDLFVADVSESHLCLLNKFNVVENHLLLVTRAFVEQESPLDRDDFTALGACLAEGEALAFYNAGAVAGASQRHKHLQLVPLPLIAEGLTARPNAEGPTRAAPPVPIEAAMSRLPFAHATAALDPAWVTAPAAHAPAIERTYRRLMQRAGCPILGDGGTTKPYNLLMTRRWMLVVPRSCESFAGISVNALGFAGAFLVRDQEQRAQLLASGPMHVLGAVAARPVSDAPPETFRSAPGRC